MVTICGAILKVVLVGIYSDGYPNHMAIRMLLFQINYKNFTHVLRGWSSRPQELHLINRHIQGETGLAVHLILP